MTCVKFVFGRVEAVFRPLIVSIQFWKTEIKTTSLRSDHGAVSCLVSSFTLQDFTTIKMLTCICRNNIIESITTGAKPVALLGSLVSQHFLVDADFRASCCSSVITVLSSQHMMTQRNQQWRRWCWSTHFTHITEQCSYTHLCLTLGLKQRHKTLTWL